MVPLAAPPVAPALTAAIKEPRCALPAAEAYALADVESSRACSEAAERLARKRHAALSSAVNVREKAVAEALKGGK